MIILVTPVASYSYQLTTTADQDYNDGDTLFLQDQVQTLFAYANNGGFCITRDIVNNSLIPEESWADITVNGRPICFKFSPAGDNLYIGTTSGRIYRMSGLRDAYDTEALQNADLQQIYSGGTVITDIDLDANDPDRLIASRGSYNNSSHVIYCDDAPNAESADDFEEIWSVDSFLANMPVYSITFDRGSDNPDRVIAGTEFGIFVTDNLGDTEWEECNTGDIYRVPVYDLRQQTKPGTINENTIYAGTHGGGVFAAGHNLVGIRDIVNNTVEFSGISIYPNPVSDVAKMDIKLENTAEVTVDYL